MTAQSHRISMSPQQLRELSKIISDRSGMHYPEHEMRIIEPRLCERVAGLGMDNFDQYIAFLTIGPYQMDEFEEMLSHIRIGESRFFGEDPQLGLFENRVLPKLLAARSAQKHLRIWSATCSTGEEPFTIAMLLHRTLGERLDEWHIEILGTDLSEKSLDIARRGIYTPNAVRNMRPQVLGQYFSDRGVDYMLCDEIRSMVSFEKHNLTDSMGAQRHGVWDVIFCRDLLTRFNDNTKNAVISMFKRQLADDGALFVDSPGRIEPDTNHISQSDITPGCCVQNCEHACSKAGD